jgi:hypothetical protein
MIKKLGLLVFSAAMWNAATAQDTNNLDSLPDYDVLFSDLEHFIDSITAPRSFATANIGISRGYFQYITGQNKVTEKSRLLITPSAGYYHKSGFGIGAVGSIITEGKTFTEYQTAATASYDYLKNRKLMTGISYTHFFTKDSLQFYTSPLNDEISAYFTYRSWWLRPAVAVVYGWGSINSVEEHKQKIKLVKRGPPVTQTTRTESNLSIADISFSASVKHDFYWLNVASKRDYIRLSPQLVARGGTQRYGLAETNNTYVSEKHSSTTILYNTENNFVSAHTQFQLLSLSARIRAEYSKGIFFVQPQFMVDYFVPEKENKLAAAFVINTGILF